MSKFRKPFRAPPMRGKDGKVIPFRETRKGTLVDKITNGGLYGSTQKKKAKAGPRAAQQNAPLLTRSQRTAKRSLWFDEGKGSVRLIEKGRKNGGWFGFAVLTISLCLIAFGLVLRFGLPTLETSSSSLAPDAGMPAAGPQDTLSAQFALCDGPVRTDCVVDGDTIWFAGDKIRVLDINTPETSTPQCDAELALGRAATDRLRQLLNAGPFSLESGPEETDRYGRKLRRITRGGQSLGDILVNEGLAEPWQGFRRNWC